VAEVSGQAPACTRCARDDAPLVVNDAGSSLCLGCVDELGEAAEVDPDAVAVLRVLTAAKLPGAPRN
jgi:hypothetical protein